MSRWSEWDSAYSLSLLFTLALISPCFCIYAFLSVCLSPRKTHSLFLIFLLFISICKLFRSLMCGSVTLRCRNFICLGEEGTNALWNSAHATLKMGLLTPALDVSMNKILQGHILFDYLGSAVLHDSERRAQYAISHPYPTYLHLPDVRCMSIDCFGDMVQWCPLYLIRTAHSVSEHTHRTHIHTHTHLSSPVQCRVTPCPEPFTVLLMWPICSCSGTDLL